MSFLVRVGACDLDSRDAAVLRSLIQLLDGQVRCALRFDEQVGDCQIVFVPAGWERRLPASCITVRVADVDVALDDDSHGFTVSMPLRAAEVRAVLEAAVEMLVQGMHAAASEGVRALFLALSRHLAARERRATIFALSDGHRLLVDFAQGRVHATMPLPTLLAGIYVLAAPKRAEAADIQALAAAPVWRLHDLVWELAARLGDAEVAGGDYPGHYRLVRHPATGWPAYPAFRRLAAGFQAAPSSLADACTRAHAEPAQAQWFLQAGLALGLLAPVAEAAPGEGAGPGASRPLMDRLAARLKPW